MSDRAVAAGSVTPWEEDGMSIHQLRAGRERAAAQGRAYDDHGATVAG